MAQHQPWPGSLSTAHQLSPFTEDKAENLRGTWDIPKDTQPSSDRARTRSILPASQIWGSLHKPFAPPICQGPAGYQVYTVRSLPTSSFYSSGRDSQKFIPRKHAVEVCKLQECFHQGSEIDNGGAGAEVVN